MTNKKKIEKFIIDNDISLEGYGSGANSNMCVLCGYALFLEMDSDELEDILIDEDYAIDDIDELRKVFIYAEENNYGEWWQKSKAKKMYKF